MDPTPRKPWTAADYLLAAGALVPLALFLWWRLDTHEPAPVILLVQHTFDYALAVPAVFAVVLLARGRRRVAAVFAMTAAFSFFSQGARGGPRPASPAADGTDLKLLSWNMKFNNHRDNALPHYVQATNADVLVLAEWSQAHEQKLSAGLQKNYPWVHAVPNLYSYGIGIYSKVPLRFLAGSEYSVMETSWEIVEIGNDGLCLAAVHLVSTIPGLMFSEGYLGHSDLMRRMEIMRIQRATAGCRHAVWAGDFNDTPNSQLYRMVTGSMVDDLAAVQLFPERTFKWKGLMRAFPVRIDYVFSDPGIAVKYGQVLEGEGSDHKALLVTLRIPTSREAPAAPAR